jgi:hypothetical protein
LDRSNDFRRGLHLKYAKAYARRMPRRLLLVIIVIADEQAVDAKKIDAGKDAGDHRDDDDDHADYHAGP